MVFRELLNVGKDPHPSGVRSVVSWVVVDSNGKQCVVSMCIWSSLCVSVS